MAEWQPGGERRVVIGGVWGTKRMGLSARAILGLVIMSLGVLWTLDNLDIMRAGPILRWWPAVILLFGVLKIGGLGTPRNAVWGGILAFVGGWLLLESFGYVRMNIWDFWPLALVAIGLGIVSRSFRRGGGPSSYGDADAPRIGAMALMSAVDRKVNTKDFRGGELTAVMGGIKLDLRGAGTVPEGAVVDVVVCWGGLDIMVPDDWKIVNEATIIMGGLDDRSRTPPPDARNVLILRGMVCMGGVEIKN